jgi:hypothetical protein
MKDRVLIHKETGELCLETMKLESVLLYFKVLRHKFGYIVHWNENDFIDMGLL